MPEPTEQKSYRCRHILTAGRRCRSAALRSENFCYYHQTTRDPSPEHRGCNPLHSECLLPSLEDRAAIQHSLSQILNRISTNQLDEKRARLLLYGLQIAAYLLPKEPRAQLCTQEEEPEPAVEDLTHDPELGSLAPITEFISREDEEEDRRKNSFSYRLLQELRSRQAEASEPEPPAEPESEEAPEEETIPTIQAVADYQLPTNHYQLSHHPLKPIAQPPTQPTPVHTLTLNRGRGVATKSPSHAQLTTHNYKLTTALTQNGPDQSRARRNPAPTQPYARPNRTRRYIIPRLAIPLNTSSIESGSGAVATL